MTFFGGIYYRQGRNTEVEIQFQSYIKQYEALASSNTLFSFQLTGSISQLGSQLFLLTDLILYNKAELEQLISSYGATKEALVLQAYQKWGKDCARYLKGDFAGAIWDSTKEELYCFRDRLGNVPFYYYLDEEVCIFSNKIQFITNHPKAAIISEDWVEAFITQAPQNNVDTPYTHIKRLPPASTLVVSKTSASTDRYWSLGDKQIATPTNIGEATETFIHLIEQSVWNRTGNTGEKIGVELSGGLDSSAIAAIAANKNGSNLYTYSNKLPEAYRGYYEGFDDEYKKIETIKEYLGITNHTYLDTVTDTPLHYTEQALDAIGYPTNMNVNIYQQSIYGQVQKNNVSTLLSGFGGDEMLSANLNNIHLKHLITYGKLNSAVKHIRRHGYPYAKALLWVIYNYIYKSRFEPQANQAKSKIINSVLLHPYKHIAYSTPVLSQHSYTRSWHEFRIGFAATVERLETGYHISGAYGIRYLYPLLDSDTLDFFYHLPDEWKLDHKYGRALFRKAIKNLLPPGIVESRKPTNTAVIPVIKIETEKYFDDVKEYLLSIDPQNPVYRYIDRDKLADLPYDEPTAMMTYEMMKRLAMLAMFLNKNK